MRRLVPLILLALALTACEEGRSARGSATHDVAHDRDAPAHDAGERAGGITSGSIYNLEGEWWDATGERAPLRRLAGRPRIVAMVYTTCPQACPAIVAEMQRVEAALGADAASVGFVLASMDPERDTPAKLAEFARRAGLDPRRWTLLGADGGDVLELAAVLGVQYRATADGEFTHANVLTVLDAGGEIVHRQAGLGDGVVATAAAARRHIVNP